MKLRWKLCLCAFALLLTGAARAQTNSPPSGNGWPTYGGDAGGQRYSNAAQITRENVSGLHPVWTYHTHALESSNRSVSKSDFEATPILFHETLYLTTPFDRIIALDPETGAERWIYDPKLSDKVAATNYTSRGVAAWQGDADALACSSRIFVATLDARLIAVDSATGKPCADFGKKGQVDLKFNIATRMFYRYRFFGNTSPPTVVGDVVVVGSAVADNQAVDVEPGVVRGYDVRSGRLLWIWDPLPWAAKQHPRTGAGNVWAVIAADPANHLVFLPTGAPSPDFYGGLRPGDNKDANSIVALDARTGKKVWAFQLVHHDVWDYDVASEPLLFEFRGHIPAVAVAAKPGILFVLNRLTGEPLYPVEERPVPASDVLGEHLSATQPFSSLPSLNPTTLNPSRLMAEGVPAECAAKLSKLRYDGIFTPPSLQGTLEYPGSLGGVNWGSMSFDPQAGVLYANTNRSAYEVRLVPQLSTLWQLARAKEAWTALAMLVVILGLIASAIRRRFLPVVVGIASAAVLLLAGSLFVNPNRFQRNHNMVNSPDAEGELSPDTGAPYRIFRRVLQDNEGRPCTPQPWGATVALDLNAGKLLWEKPLGTLIAGEHTGTVGFGAPIVTAGGLLFAAASAEPLLRAIDKTTGEEVWAGKLPVPAQSTPMTYTLHGRQFVVVDAGGHGGLGTPLGDSVVAFALN